MLAKHNSHLVLGVRLRLLMEISRDEVACRMYLSDLTARTERCSIIVLSALKDLHGFHVMSQLAALRTVLLKYTAKYSARAGRL